jgi:hypothetical protein
MRFRAYKKRAQCSLFVWVGGIIVACWIWDAVMQGCKDARMQGCKDARMQGCKDARMQGCKDARMQGCKDLMMHFVFYQYK